MWCMNWFGSSVSYTGPTPADRVGLKTGDVCYPRPPAFIIPSAEEVMFSPVCPSVYQRGYSKLYELIFMKCGEQVGHDRGKKQFNFGRQMVAL